MKVKHMALLAVAVLVSGSGMAAFADPPHHDNNSYGQGYSGNGYVQPERHNTGYGNPWFGNNQTAYNNNGHNNGWMNQNNRHNNREIRQDQRRHAREARRDARHH